MIDNNYFDHTWNGLHMWEMNPKYEGSNICAENIVMDIVSTTKYYSIEEAKGLALSMFNTWKNSAGHNAQMLEKWNNAYGFGFAVDNQGNVYGVQEFIED